MTTVLAELVAKQSDSCGYITYVFEITDKEDKARIQSKYVMCVRFPNWEHGDILIGEPGYLSYQEIRAGVDTWYNGSTMIPYRYNMIQFIKFVTKPQYKEFKYILLR